MYSTTNSVRKRKPYQGLADRNQTVLPTTGPGSDEVLPVGGWTAYDLDSYIAIRLGVFGSPSCDIGVAKEALVKADLVLGSPTFRSIKEAESVDDRWVLLTADGRQEVTTKPARMITEIIINRIIKELPE